MKEFFTNPTVIVPAIAWIVAQFLKFGFKAIEGDVNLKYFVKSGNMPSVHTAIVTSLLVAVGFVEGVDSTFFGIALVLAMIVTYDAINVRRAVGEQGTLIERLIQIQKDRLNKVTPRGEKINLVEVLGHTPLEVAAGALVGLVVGSLLMHNYWSQATNDFFWTYGGTEILVAKIVLVAVLIVSMLGYIFLKGKSVRKLPSAKSLASKTAYSLWLPSVFGLFLVWAHDVSLGLFSSKMWMVLTIGWMIVATVVIMPKVVRNFKDNRQNELKELKAKKKQKRQKRRKK